MRLAIYILLMCLWAVPAYAQQNLESLCQQLAQYVPVEGVEFDPAAAEVPVDLAGVQDPVYGSINIPVEIDLAEYFNRPDLNLLQGLNLKPDVSEIIVNQDGSIYYNGQEISADIRQFCDLPPGPGEEMREEAITPVPVRPKPDVQPPKPKPVKPKPKPIKKSSVKVFNGPKDVIVPKSAIVSEKPKPKEQNSIDVEVLKKQDNTVENVVDNDDDDSIIEGQYP